MNRPQPHRHITGEHADNELGSPTVAPVLYVNLGAVPFVTPALLRMHGGAAAQLQLLTSDEISATA
jgi:hypothetical protein